METSLTHPVLNDFQLAVSEDDSRVTEASEILIWYFNWPTFNPECLLVFWLARLLIVLKSLPFLEGISCSFPCYILGKLLF